MKVVVDVVAIQRTRLRLELREIQAPVPLTFSKVASKFRFTVSLTVHFNLHEVMKITNLLPTCQT